MAFRRYLYNTTPSNLEGIDWVTSPVYAQLLNITHTYSALHTTRNNLISATVGNPLALTNKTKTIVTPDTFLSCDQIQFTAAPSAKFIAFLIGDSANPELSDLLLGLVDLNDGVAEEVSVNFGIGFNRGLFRLTLGA